MRVFRYTIFLALAVAAAAHPLGNFSVNQYSGLEIGKAEIKLSQVLDLAEIPTFQNTSAIDTDKDGKIAETELAAYMDAMTPEYISRLSLSIDGVRLPLSVRSRKSEIKPGEGGLPIITFRWDLTTVLPQGSSRGRVVFVNGNNADRVGWNELVVRADTGISVFDSTAFGNSMSNELRAFPAERVSSPLSERSGEFSFAHGSAPDGSKPLHDRDGALTRPVQRDNFADLINVPEITLTIALVGLLVAFGFGAMHAMSPGHGKAVVGAYLVGSQGTPKHAALLGLTVTVTHTIGVFALGFVTLFASKFILPERLMPVLSFASGLLVLYIGLTMFRKRLVDAFGAGGHHHTDDEHLHEHHIHGNLTHTHDGHTHTHLPPNDLSWKNLVALGVSGGLLPCPSALVLMLSAINLNRVGYGLILTVAFSFGLASTLTAVGLLFLYGGRVFNGEKFKKNPLVRALPVFSAFVIACLGAVICYTSL